MKKISFLTHSLKQTSIFFASVIIFISCGANNKKLVGTNSDLEEAITSARPGDEIVLKNGIWNDLRIRFNSVGTKSAPITLRAETPGKTIISGVSDLKFSGEFLIVKDLYFTNGYTPSNTVIDFRDDGKVANNCSFENNVIENFNQLKRDRPDHWIEFWGRDNKVANNYLAGKTNRGPTVRVMLKGNENIYNYHQIVGNHFGPRPRKGGPRAETIQIGDSYTSMTPSYAKVANNLFERCNGEVEVISNKSNFNEFRNNVFYKSEGSLVMRHGNYCTIDGNFFIGDENSDNIGGIRLINTGHWVTNNYFINLRGGSFRSPLAVMNGIPKSPLNRYNQVTDVVVAFNTWVNCSSPWQFGVGVNTDQSDVLPPSEIRSARPERAVVANNIIYNEKGDPNPVVEHDKVDGVEFKNNLIVNQNEQFKERSGLTAANITMEKFGNELLLPKITDELQQTFDGFEFEKISRDLFGNSRINANAIGATAGNPAPDFKLLDVSKYGTDWFNPQDKESAAQSISVSNTVELEKAISESPSGSTIRLNEGEYQVANSLEIKKSLTISASGSVKILFSGEEATPLFEMHPNGKLSINNLMLGGSGKNYAFASLKENMSAHYNLSVSNSTISNFGFVLKGYKETFADSITFVKTAITDCKNGLELSAETNDKGDYNAEFLTVRKCAFENVEQNVIDYYRGGYDESTIGGNLLVSKSVFNNCGAKEKNGILLNTRGIINVRLEKNVFENNHVKLVALLWGAKNNSHSENTIVNSGKILVRQNIKLTLVY